MIASFDAYIRLMVLAANAENSFIDEDHLNVFWYGGRVAEMEKNGYKFILGAYGDVICTLLDDKNNEIAYVKDRQNAGRFYEEMHRYIPNDAALEQLVLSGELAVENNNWWEVLIDGPDGRQHDLGWVCESDNLIDAIEEVIFGMDDAIKEIEGAKQHA